MRDKSPYFVESKPLNRLDELRERFHQLESLLGGIEKAGLGDRAMEIPELLDQASAIMHELELDEKLPPEEAARFETIGAQLRSKAGLFLRAIGGGQRLESFRRAHHPEPERWWWSLDLWLAGEKRQQGKRLLISALVVVAVLAVLGVLYQVFLAPSPQEAARLQFEAASDRLIMEGNVAGALQEIENALALAPTDPILLVRKGVLLGVLGRAAEAGEVFAQAEAASVSRKEFLLTRGQDWLAVGNFDAAAADAQAALEEDAESPEAYLLLGQVYELTEKFAEAIESYEKASSLADAQNRPDLTALARVRLAYMMQRAP
jgi:tetratricopeptide (TPR) repeat protein